MLRVYFNIGVVFLSLLLLGGMAAGKESAGLPVRYDATTLQGYGPVCPPTDLKDAVRATISQDIRSLLPTIDGHGACGCGGQGWTRIAYLDMTDPTEQCPPTWMLITSPKRSCGRFTGGASCDSTTFSAGGLQYSQVCGRIIGYQLGSPNAFDTGTDILDSYYVDGVSVTHGSLRQHVWTFVGAIDEIVHEYSYIITELY